MAEKGNSKRPQSEKRKNARAASRKRGEKRHENNRVEQDIRAGVNARDLIDAPLPLLASVQQHYGPTTSRYGKAKRPSKVLRALRRQTDPKVAEKRAAHRAAS